MKHNHFHLHFLIVGAHKSGTTWLADMLRQHPGLHIPAVKEVNYFNDHYFRFTDHEGLNPWYVEQFRAGQPGQLNGEASTGYMFGEAVAERIYSLFPQVKLLAVLRDPADRLFSNYLFWLSRGVTTQPTFEGFLKELPGAYERGNYHTLLSRFYKVFPREHIKIMLYDELLADVEAFLAEVHTYLGVEAMLPPGVERRSNETGQAKYLWVNKALSDLKRYLRRNNMPYVFEWVKRLGLGDISLRIMRQNIQKFEERPQLEAAMRAKLIEFYREEIEKTGELIGRDLSDWLEVQPR